MIHLPGAVSMVAAIASITLAIVVFRRAPDRRLGRVFGWLAISLLFWNLNFVVLYSVADYGLAFTLSWVFRTGAVFLLPAILHLCLVLPGRPIRYGWRLTLWADYGLALVLALLNLFGLLVTRLATFEWGYYSIGTPYYNLFPLLVVVNSVLPLGVLVREYWTTSEPRMRLQLKFWLLGLAIATPLALTNLLPSYGISFYPLGNLGSAVWAGIVGYAIVRYRLMDIELVVTRALGFLCATAVVVVPVFMLTLLLQDFAFHEVHYDFSVALALLLTTVGVAFSGFRGFIEGRLERALFPAKVASRIKLSALGGEMVRVLDRDRLLDLISESLSGAFDLDGLALYVFGDPRRGFELVRAVGRQAASGEVSSDSALARWLRKVGEPVIREEALGADKLAGSEQIGKILESNGWDVCVPFIAAKQLLGFAALGRQKGLRAYSTGDLNILSRVASEASIALQNARLYEELGKSREIISRAGRLSAIGTLAAGVAHEIRNPLVSIQTFFQLAPNRLDDEEFMTSFLSLAEHEVQRISDLISELLMFAKSPSPAIREVDLNEIVERVVTLLSPQAHTGRITLIRRAGPGLPPVLGDSDQLMQVCLNLCLNAIQATPENGEVVVETREDEHQGERSCEILVVDSGAGIPVSIRESIFDPFFTTKDKGSGLGLAICHQIVVESGGFMTVESVEGRGSTFRVSLPAVATRQVHPASEGDVGSPIVSDRAQSAKP